MCWIELLTEYFDGEFGKKKEVIIKINNVRKKAIRNSRKNINL